MEKSVLTPGTRRLIAVALVSALMACSVFFSLVDRESIVGDGLDHLTIAYNVIHYSSFSSGSPDKPDMAREPAWPLLAACVIRIASLEKFSLDILSSRYFYVWKMINIFLYSIIIGFAAAYLFSKTRSRIFLGLFLMVALFLYGTMPRLINNFNNEALAALLVLVNSMIFYEMMKGRLMESRCLAPAFLGTFLGFLALTKAQFLYISIPLLIVLFVDNKQKALIVLLALLAVTGPWLYRNFTLFDDPAIAKRGKIVASVRVVLTAEPNAHERLCMAYAFSHPAIQPYLEPLLGVTQQDFFQGGKCRKLNREICFDMGTKRVHCAPFPEDAYFPDWTSKVQYFYRGYYAGVMMEQNRAGFTDITRFDLNFLKNYIKTLPLFAWRGFGFSDFPLISVLISLSVFGLLFTSYWPFALLCVSSQLFHIFLTHNIPRYHAVEFPVLIISATYLLWLSWHHHVRFIQLFGRKSLHGKKADFIN
jgi:hypothetical protein